MRIVIDDSSAGFTPGGEDDGSRLGELQERMWYILMANVK